MSDHVSMFKTLFPAINGACPGFTYATKTMAGDLKEDLSSGFNPTKLTKQLADQFDQFLGMDKGVYDWNAPTVVKSSDCQQVEIEFPAVDQTDKAAQRVLKSIADKNCGDPNSALKDACFTLTKPDGSSIFCSLTKGCKQTDAPLPPQAEDTSPIASADATVSEVPPLPTDPLTTSTTDETTPIPTPTATPTPDATSSSGPSSSGTPTTPTDVWGLTKVGGGSIATLFLAYKAIKETHKWYTGSNQNLTLDLPSLAEGRTIESIADAPQKKSTPANSGWRALAYSTAAAASLAFTAYSL